MPFSTYFSEISEMKYLLSSLSRRIVLLLLLLIIRLVILVTGYAVLYFSSIIKVSLSTKFLSRFAKIIQSTDLELDISSRTSKYLPSNSLLNCLVIIFLLTVFVVIVGSRTIIWRN